MSLLTEKVIDVRDLIARYEELEDEREGLETELEDAEQSVEIASPDDEEEMAQAHDRLHNADAALHTWQEENQDEFDALLDALAELENSGGDHEWRRAWYPVTLIADWHFEAYAEELAEDIGAISSAPNWPATCIDWERAARDLRMDYSSVEIGDNTYWYRS